MSFIKKNLLFFIAILICLAAFGAGLFLAFAESGKVKKSERNVDSTQAQLIRLSNQAPAPTEQNVSAAEQNLAELVAALAGIREDLQRGATLDISEDGVSVIAGIQQYINSFQRKMKPQGEDENPISTPDDFAFGFARYLNAAPVPEDPAAVARLDKQRQIMSYLLNQLIAAKPHSIDEVQREILEVEGDNNSFAIDAAISAAVPNAIDTMAFCLTFTGYTESLRQFLNSLAHFDLPIVVRDIKVSRPTGSETVVAATSGGNDNFLELFGGGGAQTEEAGEEWPKPVVDQNISKFTIILEFIEVVLPETQN